MENDHPLERLRLVSRRFAELQGLRVALAGSVFTLVFGTYLMVRPAQGRGGVWIALAIAFGLILPGERVIRRYYACYVRPRIAERVPFGVRQGRGDRRRPRSPRRVRGSSTGKRFPDFRSRRALDRLSVTGRSEATTSARRPPACALSRCRPFRRLASNPTWRLPPGCW